MALNAKQRLFVAAYLQDRNATASAKVAGYSKKTAHAQGHSLLKHPEIKKAINAGVEKQFKKLDITADRILARIAEFAFEKEYIKSSNILKALELLGKHRKLFTDVQEITGKDGGPQVILTMPSNGSEAPENDVDPKD